LSLQEAISVPWSNLPKKTSKLYFAMRGEVYKIQDSTAKKKIPVLVYTLKLWNLESAEFNNYVF
jgi:hypothetical protein